MGGKLREGFVFHALRAIFARTFLHDSSSPMLAPYLHAGVVEAGCDEAGRGCLAGPVYAAAVILPPDFRNDLLNDSKKLTERQRYALRPVIEAEALAWAVGVVDNREIDEINILRASILAMHRAIDQLRLRPEALLIDGNRFSPYQDLPHTTIVKGDGKMMSIAAASILAKTYRDDFMCQIDAEYPDYHWRINKGYPTADHRAAIAAHGPTPYHRLSFRLLPEAEQLTLF
jgi:ribonuclease HII